ncbi:unnamed protein product, partial [Urochloa humidicola]
MAMGEPPALEEGVARPAAPHRPSCCSAREPPYCVFSTESPLAAFTISENCKLPVTDLVWALKQRKSNEKLGKKKAQFCAWCVVRPCCSARSARWRLEEAQYFQLCAFVRGQGKATSSRPEANRKRPDIY